MDKQAVIRRVRIAVSVFFAVVTVALCVLWVRSYWQFDGAHPVLGDGKELSLYSVCGCLFVAVEPINTESEIRKFEGGPVPNILVTIIEDSPHFSIRSEPGFWQLQIPYWLPAVLCAIISVATGIGLIVQFSLRTMLIATTLVAVLLGLVVWAGR